jgi:hypothetical protein
MSWSYEKSGFLLWIFAARREFGGLFGQVYWLVIGHCLRVGAMGEKGKVQEWCDLCGWRVEMWERGVGILSRLVLPDGPTSRGAATSWRVYLVVAGAGSTALARLGGDIPIRRLGFDGGVGGVGRWLRGGRGGIGFGGCRGRTGLRLRLRGGCGRRPIGCGGW